MNIGKCEYCGKMFNKIQKTQIWCSIKCRYNGQYSKNKVNILENKSKRLWKNRNKEKRKWIKSHENKECIICKKKLIGNQYKYCSRNCMHKNWYNKYWHSFFKYKYSIKRKARDNSRGLKDSKCIICKSREKLEIHHISYIPNIYITLCRKCHIEITRAYKRGVEK